jgi:peptide/nickel transport system permease protein
MRDVRAWNRLKRHRGAWVGGAIVLLVLLAALLAPVVKAVVGVGPKEILSESQMLPPGSTVVLATQDPAAPEAKIRTELGTHWLGTDNLGRDVLVRCCYGAQWSLMLGALSIALATFIGVPVGLAAGYLGGWVDTIAMRCVDIMLAFPSILLAITIITAMGGKPRPEHVIVAIALVNVPAFARQVRGSTLVVRELDHVTASKALGAGAPRIMWRSVLPNVMAPVIVLATLGLATAILSAAGLSFLGLGIEASEPEWGAMLTGAREFLRRAPWAVLAPGGAITLTVLGVNLLGDGLRDALDPKGKR